MAEIQEEQAYTEATNGEAYEENEQLPNEEQNHYVEEEQQPEPEVVEQQQQPEQEYEPESQPPVNEQHQDLQEQQPTDGEQPKEYRPERHEDNDDRKIFVGGLSWETTMKDLREYFSKFGEVVDCTLKTDPITGRSRGFGFVTFSSVEAVDGVCEQKEHTLHGRTIDPKRAKARGGRPEPVKKVFVGGLDSTITEEDIKEHFSKFGTVVDMDLPFDKMKQQRRAFCFVTFESEAVVEDVVEDQRQCIKGREVDVKKATPRQEHQGWGQQGGWNQGGWGDRGGRGGRGGYHDRGRGRGRGGPPSNQGWGNQGWGGQQQYDYSSYYGQPGYDYNSYYSGYGNGGYGNYDYNNYYNQWGQGYGQGYGGYDQSTNYDYSGWYAQQPQQTQQQSQGQTGQDQYKAKAPAATASAQRGGSQYHPYQRQ